MFLNKMKRECWGEDAKGGDGGRPEEEMKQEGRSRGLSYRRRTLEGTLGGGRRSLGEELVASNMGEEGVEGQHRLMNACRFDCAGVRKGGGETWTEQLWALSSLGNKKVRARLLGDESAKRTGAAPQVLTRRNLKGRRGEETLGMLNRNTLLGTRRGGIFVEERKVGKKEREKNCAEEKS